MKYACMCVQFFFYQRECIKKKNPKTKEDNSGVCVNEKDIKHTHIQIYVLL